MHSTVQLLPACPFLNLILSAFPLFPLEAHTAIGGSKNKSPSLKLLSLFLLCLYEFKLLGGYPFLFKSNLKMDMDQRNCKYIMHHILPDIQAHCYIWAYCTLIVRTLLRVFPVQRERQLIKLKMILNHPQLLNTSWG